MSTGKISAFMGLFLIVCGAFGLFSALSGGTEEVPKAVFMSFVFVGFGCFSFFRGRRQAKLHAAYQLYGQGMPAAVFSYIVKEQRARTGQSLDAVLHTLKVKPGAEGELDFEAAEARKETPPEGEDGEADEADGPPGADSEK